MSLSTIQIDSSLACMREAVRAASRTGKTLRPRGGGTKDFFGGPLEGDVLDTTGYAGIVSYEPSELVITARCGTRLEDMESLLAEQGQMFAFEPPRFGSSTTIGGCVAAGLSGPRRASNGLYFGALRDHVLGCRLLNAEGELLTFGGQVMKNVAGYDVSRLTVGSMGTLGVIFEVSVKVLPRPPATATLRFELDEAESLERVNDWGSRPLPVSASMWHGGVLHVRLEGASAAVKSACVLLGGDQLESLEASWLWDSVRDHTHEFFASDRALWRVSVPSTSPLLPLGGSQLIEWGGALRWLRTDTAATEIQKTAKQAGGHARQFRGGDREMSFVPLTDAEDALHRRLKAAFDPKGVFSPRRLRPNW